MLTRSRRGEGLQGAGHNDLNEADPCGEEPLAVFSGQELGGSWIAMSGVRSRVTLKKNPY